MLFVDITTKNNKKLTIGVFYRPPNSNLKSLQDLQTCLINITTTDLLVIGDFNLSEFDWATNQPTKTAEHHNLLSEIIQDNFLHQLVDEPTREKNILDLVLTTNADFINDLEVGEPFPDNNPIFFRVDTCPYQNRVSKKEVYVYQEKPQKRQKSSFWTCQRRLIVYHTNAFSLSLIGMESTVNFYHSSEIF